MPRPLRLCDVCGGLDDHPRHTISLSPNATEGTPSQEFLDALDERVLNGEVVVVSAIAELMKPQVLVRHMDCCAAQGCPTGECPITEAEYGGRRGQELIDYLDEVRADG